MVRLLIPSKIFILEVYLIWCENGAEGVTLARTRYEVCINLNTNTYLTNC